MAYNIRCEKCGHQFEVEKWNPGMPCPKCRAADTVPMTKVGAPSADQRPPSGEDKRRAAGVGWKNSPVVAGIAIAVIVATWLVLGVWKFKKPKAMKIEIWAVCTECDERVKKLANEVPADCAKCGGKHTVHALYECKGTEGKPCGNQFAYIAPPPPSDPYANQENWDKMSEEDRNEAMLAMDRQMGVHDEAMMKAATCPKCGGFDTSAVYTEEQNKKFEELRKKYESKK